MSKQATVTKCTCAECPCNKAAQVKRKYAKNSLDELMTKYLTKDIEDNLGDEE